jgi:hypothetical protein
MQKRSNRTPIAAAVASMALAIVVSPTAAAGSDVASHHASVSTESDVLPGDGSVPFWPHETGALVGTSETFIDLRADGSYYDPSIGRRVLTTNVK